MARKSPLVAVDTNVLLDLAAEDEACWDCMDAMKSRRELPRLVVLPTVLQELAHLLDNGETEEVRELAFAALQSLLSWGFEPLDLQPVGHGIVERIGDEIRSRGLIPESERNDSFIMAEAALCDCDILISSDRQVYGVGQHALHALLNDFHVKPVMILWPKQVVRALGR